MKHKMTFAVGAAAGYVLGTRAGRERYEQMKQAAKRFMESPQAQRAKDQARSQAGDLAGMARGKAGELAGKAKGQAGELAGKAKDQAGRLKETAKTKAESMPRMPKHADEHAADGISRQSRTETH